MVMVVHLSAQTKEIIRTENLKKNSGLTLVSNYTSPQGRANFKASNRLVPLFVDTMALAFAERHTLLRKLQKNSNQP